LINHINEQMRAEDLRKSEVRIAYLKEKIRGLDYARMQQSLSMCYLIKGAVRE